MGRARETVTTCGHVLSLTSEQPKTSLFHSKEGACHSFSSTEKGNKKDNPTNLDNLTDKQLRRMVMFAYRHVSSFQVRFELASCWRNSGRNFLFATSPAHGLCKQVTTTTTTTPATQTVTIEFETLGVTDANSDGKFFIRF